MELQKDQQPISDLSDPFEPIVPHQSCIDFLYLQQYS